MNTELDYQALGMRIKTSRKNCGLTQEYLGELCSLSTAHIGHIERGTRIPSVDTLFKISSALHVSMDYLLSDSFDDSAYFDNIAAIIKGKNDKQVKAFISAVKVLANNIDEL